MIKHFINLTNGIEFLPKVSDPNFIRIQSTWCEQKQWDRLLQDLDYNLLLWLSQGYPCVIWDTSSTKEVPRAIYQGVELIRYVLNRRWFDRITIPWVKTYNCSDYFDKVYDRLEDKTKKKLDYFKKFLNTDEVLLGSACGRTNHDTTDKSEFNNILKVSLA